MIKASFAIATCLVGLSATCVEAQEQVQAETIDVCSFKDKTQCVFDINDVPVVVANTHFAAALIRQSIWDEAQVKQPINKNPIRASRQTAFAAFR